MTSIVVRLFGEDLTASKSLEHLATVGEATGKRMRKQFGDLPKWATEAAIGVAAGSTYLAANFESATTRLVTDAGEIPKNLGKVREGVLSLAGKVGETPVELAKGLYTVESAGYHGAAGLAVLKAAAEGAADGGADLRTVGDALTTTLTDYGLKAGASAAVTSQLVETVSLGKTNMEDLAGSLHSVLPGAEAAHLGLGQVLGAMATMTGEGISADQASENLNHAILSLQNPSLVSSKAMAAMGLSSTDVAEKLGKRGLTGTYDLLTSAITSHMGPSGLVVQNAFNQSKQAAASANAELRAMPKSLQSIAGEYLKGSITQKEWTTAVKAQTPANANLLKQWAATQAGAKGFSDQVKSGAGPFATYAAELSKMTGGQTGLQVALHLSGTHAETFTENVKAVSSVTSEAGGNVKGYAAMQATLNQQLKDSEAGVAVVGTRIGTALIPAVVTVLHVVQEFGGALATNQPLLYAVAGTAGVLTAALVTMFVTMKTVALVTDTAKAASILFGSAEEAGAIKTAASTVALGAQKLAMAASTAAQWLFNAAMDANPVGLVILAVAALIAIIVLLVTHWKQVTSFLQTVWGAVAKWFGDTLDSIGKWWSDTWKDVQAVFHVVLAAVVDAFTHWTLLGIIVSHWSQILSATKVAWTAVTSFIGGIPAKILGFFRGVGTWLVQIGVDLLGGLIKGIEGDLANVQATVGHIASSVIGTFKNLLGIHSPSTVFAVFGTNLIEGLQKGVHGSTDKLKTTMSTLKGDIVKAFDRKTISAGMESSLLKTLKRDSTKLETEAKRRDTIAGRLSKAQDKLTAAIGTRNDYAAGVKSGVLGLGAITGATGQSVTADDGSTSTLAVTATDEISKMQQAVAAATKFQSDISQLQSEGLNQTAYKQLVDAFQQSGDTSFADSLLAGGQSAVGQINTLQKQLSSVATSLGSSTSSTLYQAGVDSAQGVVDGLKSQEDAITDQMTKLAKSMATSFKKELGIKSPSTVMAGHGVNVVRGVIQGVRSQQDEARATIADLFGGAGPSTPGSGRAGGGRAGIGSVTINASTGASPAEIVAELDWRARIYG